MLRDRSCGAFSKKIRGRGGPSIGQNKGHFQDHLVSGYLAIVDRHFLVLHPGAFDVLQRLVGARYTLDDGVSEARRADAADLANACYCHDVSSKKLRAGCDPSGTVCASPTALATTTAAHAAHQGSARLRQDPAGLRVVSVRCVVLVNYMNTAGRIIEEKGPGSK